MNNEDREIIIATWIAANTPFVKGSTLQVHHYSTEAPDTCLLVKESGGKPDDKDVERTDLFLQVLSRCLNWQEAKSNAKIVYKFLYLDQPSYIKLPEGNPLYEIETISAVNEPQSIGQDQKERWEYSANYILRIYRN